MAETLQLEVTASYSRGASQNVTADASYVSSSDAVATVSAGGLITAVSEGSATITASFEGSNGTCTVTVTDTLEGLSVTPSTAELQLEE